MIHLYTVTKALEQYRNLKLRRQVTLQDHTVRIPTEALDDRFIRNLGALIHRLAAETPATQIASAQECRFCDIMADDCAERVDDNTHQEDGTTEDF